MFEAYLERNGINYLFPTIYLLKKAFKLQENKNDHPSTWCGSREDLGDWLIPLFLNLKLGFQPLKHRSCE